MKSWLILGALLAVTPVLASEPTQEDLQAYLGNEDSHLPPALQQLSRGMTPEAAGKVIPGAENANKFGRSRVAVKNHPFVQGYEFSFLKNKQTQVEELYSVTLLFKTSLTRSPTFYGALVKSCEAKFGAAKPEQVQKKLITWMAGTPPRVVQLHPQIGGGNVKPYALRVSL